MVEFIVAFNIPSYEIGTSTSLPWHLKDDLYFRNLTYGNIVIMGKNTYSLLDNEPFPGRFNIVVCSKVDETCKQCCLKNVCFVSIEKIAVVVNTCRILFPSKSIFVIGGQHIFNYFKDVCTKIYAIRYFMNLESDKIFPKDCLNCMELVQVQGPYTKDDIKYDFAIYQRMLFSMKHI